MYGWFIDGEEIAALPNTQHPLCDPPGLGLSPECSHCSPGSSFNYSPGRRVDAGSLEEEQEKQENAQPTLTLIGSFTCPRI